MKKILIIIIALAFSINLAAQRFSSLTETTTFGQDYILAISNPGVKTYKIEMNNMFRNVLINDSLRVTGESLLQDTVRIIKPMYIAGNLFNGTGVGSAAAGNTGEIQFNTSNIFDAESDFYWDKANNYLGLATNTPIATVHINNGVGSLSKGLIIGSPTTGVFPPANNELQINVNGFQSIKLTEDSVVTRGTFKPDSIIVPYDNVIVVAKSGSDYTSIKDAIDGITDNSITNRYTILVAPGVYLENNPIYGKEYVTVKSLGKSNTVRISALNSGQDLFKGNNFFFLNGLTLHGVTGSGYAVKMDSIGEMLVEDCIIFDCENGVLVNEDSAYFNMLNNAFYTVNEDMICGMVVNAGNVAVDFLKIIQHSDIDTIIKSCNKESILTLNNVVSFSDSVGVGMYLCDKSRVSGYGSRLSNMYDGLILEGDSVLVRFDVLEILNAKNDGFRIESTGNGIEQGLFATTITGAARFNFNIINSDATAIGNGFTELDKSYIAEGAKVFAYLLDTKGEDEGLSVFGELKVGSPAAPSESVFGGGDSYTNGMLVYEYNGSSYTNVTDSALNIDGDCVEFPNNNANTAIYVSTLVLDSAIHHGIKAYMLDSMTLGAGEVVAEYWNGSTWTEFNGMVTDGDEPYYPYAKSYFEQNLSTHIRYNIEMTNDDWQANDPMSLGSDHKWIRYRITSTITESPRIDQIKLHTSRTELNADGFNESFGNARSRKLAPLDIGAGEPFEGAMQSQTIYVDENIGVGFQTNKFTATGDKIGYTLNLADNLDTSSPLSLVWGGHSLSSGSIQWTIRYRIVSPGDILYTSEPAASGTSGTVIVNATITSGINELFQADIDVSEAIPRRLNGFGDQIWISIQPTTLPGNFSLTNIGAAYWTWSEGGHW